MYLEVYVFNSTSVNEAQVYDEATLPSFSSNEVLREEIEAKVPSIKWIDKETGRIENSDFQGQLILGNPTDDKIIYFRIADGCDPFKLILELCRANGWTSYTPENGHFLDLGMDTIKYWDDYKKYKGWINQTIYQRDKSNLD